MRWSYRKKEKGRVGGFGRRLLPWGASLLLVIAGSRGFCQTPQTDDGVTQVPSSFGLESVSAYGMYVGSVSAGQAGGLNADFGMGGAATLHWVSVRERSDISLSYTAAYDGRLRYSSLDALNHMLSFDAGYHLNQRWQLRYSTAANVVNMEQLLFLPNFYSQLAAVPATFDDLTNAVLQGKFNNPQLIPVVTGVQASVSPALLLYGARTLSASAQISLIYNLSPRTSIQLSGGAARMQELSQNDPGFGAITPVLPETTSGSVNLSLSYSVSPRTEIGIQAGSTRVISAFEDAYYDQSSVFVNRTLSRRWFASMHAGGGLIQPVRFSTYLPVGPQYSVGGTLGFKTLSQTVFVSAERTFADVYGLGAGSSITVSGAWNWAVPGTNWRFEASASEARFMGGFLPGINSWQAGGGLTRILTRNTTLSAEYSYIHYNGGPNAALLAALSPSAARLVFTWTPRFGVQRASR